MLSLSKMSLGGGGSKGVQLTAEEMELLMGGLGGDLPALPGPKAQGGDDSAG